MESKPDYTLVRLPNGAHGLHSLAYGETMHPVVGPVVEAEALFVRQLRLGERLRRHAGEFVIWDVGLGGAANALTVLRAARAVPGTMIRLLSFDSTVEPLKFALQHTGDLGYLEGYESCLRGLLVQGHASLENGLTPTPHPALSPPRGEGEDQERVRVVFPLPPCRVEWELRRADFPDLIRQPEAGHWPKPHLIMFDPFSPAKNPAMWTQPLFARLFSLLDPDRPCVMPTYSRSTMLRVSLLLAGFFVGAGQAVGRKEETTLAANCREFVEAPLDGRWLAKARRSTSAEPLWEPVYRRAGLSAESWERLRGHAQFR